MVAACKAHIWDPSTPKLGAPPQNLRGLYPSVPKLEVPFASKRKMKLTVHPVQDCSFMGVKLPEGTTHIAIVKGAPDRIFPVLTKAFPGPSGGDLVDLGNEGMKAIMNINKEYSSMALRVLLTAAKPLTDAEVETLSNIEESSDVLQAVLDGGLVFLGMTGLKDPPRAGVAESVNRARAAGVDIVMITGDQVGRCSRRELLLQLWLFPTTEVYGGGHD